MGSGPKTRPGHRIAGAEPLHPPIPLGGPRRSVKAQVNIFAFIFFAALDTPRPDRETGSSIRLQRSGRRVAPPSGTGGTSPLGPPGEQHSANHRFAFDDAVLIKDNHVAIAGSVTEAVGRVRRSVGHLVEVDDLDQLQEARPRDVTIRRDRVAPASLRPATGAGRSR